MHVDDEQMEDVVKPLADHFYLFSQRQSRCLAVIRHSYSESGCQAPELAGSSGSAHPDEAKLARSDDGATHTPGECDALGSSKHAAMPAKESFDRSLRCLPSTVAASAIETAAGHRTCGAADSTLVGLAVPARISALEEMQRVGVGGEGTQLALKLCDDQLKAIASSSFGLPHPTDKREHDEQEQ